MLTKVICVGVILLTTSAFSRPSSAESASSPIGTLAPAQFPEWVASLKCRDLLTPTADVNQATFPAFAMWFAGYLSGLGSALPLDNLPANHFDFFRWAGPDQLDAMVLAVCSDPNHLNDSAAETAVDTAAMVANVASHRTVKLRGTDGKWQ